LRRNVASKDGEVVRAGVARRDHGRRCLVRHQLVGGDADRRAIGEHVRMQVDEPRGHQLAFRIEDAQSTLRGYVGLQRLNRSEADSDVTPCAKLLARVEHLAALDDKVEFVIRSHRRVHGSDDQRG
jgi:hypothetical protein